jgi:hypothetical protein
MGVLLKETPQGTVRQIEERKSGYRQVSGGERQGWKNSVKNELEREKVGILLLKKPTDGRKRFIN